MEKGVGSVGTGWRVNLLKGRGFSEAERERRGGRMRMRRGRW